MRTSPENAEPFPGDHAGKLETSEAMVICPEYVDMDRYDDSLWHVRSAREARAEYGEAALNAWSQDAEAVLFGSKP
jgi:creatinine amidohydrolase/Fe(II)-dependent formamide hydrolase-like protein